MRITTLGLSAAILLIATGCPPVDDTGGPVDDTGTDTADTGDTGVTMAECTLGSTVTVDGTDYELFLDGLQVLVANPNLSATGFQSFTAESCDWTFGDNILNIYQTGVTDLANGWDEEHVIPSAAHTDGTADAPRTDHLELAIDHVDTIGELTGDDKTLFNTDDDGGLTYALRIFNEDGTLADCIAWGHDVPGMFAGQVPSTNPDGHTDAAEISSANCATVAR